MELYSKNKNYVIYIDNKTNTQYNYSARGKIEVKKIWVIT